MSEQKKKSFSFKWQNGFGYIIGYWILELGFRIVMNQIRDNYHQIAENDADNEYLYVCFINISDLCALFIIFFYKKCDKIYLWKKRDNESKKKKFFVFFGLFVLDLFARLTYFNFHKIFNLEDEEVSPKFARDIMILIDVEMRFIFYIFILKKELHNHKVFSIISILIIYILLTILDLINMHFTGNYDIMSCIYYSLILLIRSILFPLVDTVAKKYMYEKDLLPSEYMSYRGVIEFFLLSILTCILLLTSNLHFTSDIFSTKLAVVAPIYILSCFGKAFLLLNVIDKFSSQSVSFLIISESLAESINVVINIFKDKENMSKTVNIIISTFEILLVILIGIVTMIYEEIIIIRICGLEKDVKDEINNRANKDENLISNPNLDQTIMPIQNPSING